MSESAVDRMCGYFKSSSAPKTQEERDRFHGERAFLFGDPRDPNKSPEWLAAYDAAEARNKTLPVSSDA